MVSPAGHYDATATSARPGSTIPSGPMHCDVSWRAGR